MTERLILSGVGDVNIMTEGADPDKPESVFELVGPLLKNDISYFNQEAIYSPKSAPPWRGDHRPRVNPSANAAALTFAGFNVGSMANNHTMDLGWEYVKDTLDLLKEKGIQAAGIGVNLAEARKPAIVEKKGTKVAFLSFNMVGPAEGYAGPANPGCAYVRVIDHYERIEHQPGTPVNVYTFADQQDLDLLQQDIVQAKKAADLVVLAFHWGIHFTEHLLGMYQEQVAHAAIDTGADLIFGSHPHLIKGMEVYKGKAIFYSLGNFAMREQFHGSNDYSRIAGAGHTQQLDMLYGYRLDPKYKLYASPPKSRTCLIARCLIENKKIEKVTVRPGLINALGQPEPLKGKDPRFAKFLEYLDAISKSQGRSLALSQEGDEILVSAGKDPSKPLVPNVLRFYNPYPSCEDWA
jgi:hypothetical protein